eukprot:5919180-Amphidinium_carterae.1
MPQNGKTWETPLFEENSLSCRAFFFFPNVGFLCARGENETLFDALRKGVSVALTNIYGASESSCTIYTVLPAMLTRTACHGFSQC